MFNDILIAGCASVYARCLLIPGQLFFLFNFDYIRVTHAQNGGSDTPPLSGITVFVKIYHAAFSSVLR